MSQEITEVIEQHGKAVNEFKAKTDARIEELERKSSFLDSAIAEICQKGEGFRSMPGTGNKSVFTTIQNDAGLTALRNRQTKSAIINLDGGVDILTKAITGDGANPYGVPVQHDSRLAENPMRVLTAFDVLPRLPVTSNLFEFNQLDNYSNAATYQSAEGIGKATATVKTELKSVPIFTIAHIAKASEQVLSDAPALANQVSTLLRYGVLAKASAEILAGNTSDSIEGLDTIATAYNAVKDTPLADAIGGAATALDTAGWNANLVVMSPADWFSIRSERTATEKAYIGGGWSTVSANTIWGIQVLTSPSITNGHPLVMDTSQVAILDRQQAVVEIGRDGSDFSKNLLSLRAELRVGLAVFSPTAVRRVVIATV